MADEVGDAHVVVYLSGVTGELIEELAGAIGDLLVARGLGVSGDDQDAQVHALVGVLAEAFPDLADPTGFLERHAMLVVPGGGDDEPEDPA